MRYKREALQREGGSFYTRAESSIAHGRLDKIKESPATYYLVPFWASTKRKANDSDSNFYLMDLRLVGDVPFSTRSIMAYIFMHQSHLNISELLVNRADRFFLLQLIQLSGSGHATIKPSGGRCKKKDKCKCKEKKNKMKWLTKELPTYRNCRSKSSSVSWPANSIKSRKRCCDG